MLKTFKNSFHKILISILVAMFSMATSIASAQDPASQYSLPQDSIPQNVSLQDSIPFDAMSPEVSQRNPLAKEAKSAVVDSIAGKWGDWKSLTVNGKLKMAGLPLSPSVKMYMVKDSCVSISLRAPFVGEVGRAEIDSDTILVVNKMKKTYVKEPIDSLLAQYPVTLDDVQSLLLGRVVLPAYGTLLPEDSEKVELFPEDYGEYSLIPAEGFELDLFNYGYLISSDYRPSVLMVIPSMKPEINVNVSYEYGSNGYDIVVSYQSPKKIYSGSLQFNEPTEGGNPIEPIKLNDKYRQLSFGDFIKSF